MLNVKDLNTSQNYSSRGGFELRMSSCDTCSGRMYDKIERGKFGKNKI